MEYLPISRIGIVLKLFKDFGEKKCRKDWEDFKDINMLVLMFSPSM